jgi:hypothetical protein
MTVEEEQWPVQQLYDLWSTTLPVMDAQVVRSQVQRKRCRSAEF